MRRYSIRERFLLAVAAVFLLAATSVFFLNRETFSRAQQLTALSVSLLTVAIALRIVVTGASVSRDDPPDR